MIAFDDDRHIFIHADPCTGLNTTARNDGSGTGGGAGGAARRIFFNLFQHFHPNGFEIYVRHLTELHGLGAHRNPVRWAVVGRRPGATNLVSANSFIRNPGSERLFHS